MSASEILRVSADRAETLTIPLVPLTLDSPTAWRSDAECSVTVGPTAMSGTGEEGKLPIKGHYKRNMDAGLGSIYEAAGQADRLFIQ